MVKQHTNAFSLLEAIVALAVFALVAAAIVTLLLGGWSASSRQTDLSQAERLATSGLEAARAIAAHDWLAMDLTATGLVYDNNEWRFLGQGTSDQTDNFSRQLLVAPVCRDSVSQHVVTCPSGYQDDNSRQITAVISWPNQLGQTVTTSQQTFIINLATTTP